MDQRESPLKRRLGKLAKQISILGYIAAVLVALSYLFHVFLIDSGMRPDVIRLKLTDLNYLFTALFHAFTLSLTVIVVAVPEGLPMMIAVVLSANVRRMVRDQVLVRKPVGIEAAGSMDLLFTDKTGTLTEGRMAVVSLLFAGGETFSDLSLLRRRCGPGAADLLSLGLRGSAASPDASGRPVGGSATERALLSFVLSDSVPAGCRMLSSLPFDSARKYSAVTWMRDGSPLTVLLGAPERVLPCTCGALTPDGGREGRDLRGRVDAELRRMNAAGRRSLAVAVASDPAAPRASALAEGIHGDFLLLGILELSDPVRADAPGAVRDLHGAGVQVVMVTGDSRGTAQAIAAECGILCDTYSVILTSDELARLSDLQLRELLPRLAVVSRALPTDKSRLVRVAQEAGRVTGMTGDGINDAPALRRADVGFAMGGGTQVAKDAGDIVILDDRLSSIVRAVLYGRTVFKSIPEVYHAPADDEFFRRRGDDDLPVSGDRFAGDGGADAVDQSDNGYARRAGVCRGAAPAVLYAGAAEKAGRGHSEPLYGQRDRSARRHDGGGLSALPQASAPDLAVPADGRQSLPSDRVLCAVHLFLRVQLLRCADRPAPAVCGTSSESGFPRHHDGCALRSAAVRLPRRRGPPHHASDPPRAACHHARFPLCFPARIRPQAPLARFSRQRGVLTAKTPGRSEVFRRNLLKRAAGCGIIGVL